MKEGFQVLENVERCKSIKRPGEKNACKFCGKEFDLKYKLSNHVIVDHDDLR